MKYSIWMKLALIILSASMIFSLVACTPSGGTETEGTSEAESSESESTKIPVESDEKNPVTSSESDFNEITENTEKTDTTDKTEKTEESEESEESESSEAETTEPKIDTVFDLVDFTVSVPADREPVILQITDTQIIDASQNDRLGASSLNFWGPEHKGVECFDYISEIVEKTSPDLILLTGDIVYGEFDNNGSSFLALVEFMESLGVPWAPIFGNHEAESAMGVNWQCEQLEAAENCLFLQRDITGNGNYTVGIEQGGVMTRVFFMLDSNGCSAASTETLINNTHFKTSSGFGNDQIKWYTKLINSIKELSPETKFSFAFHIQIKAIVDALETYATGADTAFIDRLSDKNEGDFGYIGESKATGWDTDYSVWNGLKALGVDSIFVGHVHTHSASIVYEGVRVQFGMKSSTYDQINYVTSEGKIEAGYHLSGKTPWVGGTVMKLAADGAISDAYIYYCENAGGNIDWDSLLTCKHTESTNEWIVNANDPQYESTICSVCGEPATRSRTTTDEGLLLFGHELIKNKVGNNAELLNDGPGGMSYVRLHATKESGNEAVLLHGDKNNALTNLGGYVAILYRTSAKQKLLYAIDSNYSVQNGGVQKLATDSSNGMWDFVVHKNPTHEYYDGEKLTAFAFYYFAADTVRTLDDYTDVAFIGFFSTEEEAWDFFEQYRTVYEFESGKDLANKYYVHLNGGDTKIDDNRLITGANASINKPHVFDCSAFPITYVADSLKLYGWCATPGGISEYGYYVVDGDNKSDYIFITNGKDSTSSGILSQFAAYNYPASSGVGILMGSTNPVKINLAGYENKTVTVIYVAKTNWGAEIELAYFTSVKVPCDHSGSLGDWVLDTTNPQYEITTCSSCGETASRPVKETEEGLLLFSPDFIKNQAGTNANATVMNEGGMSFVRITPVAETGNKNILLHANNVDPLTNLGGYVAILYRTSVDQKLKLAFDSTHNYIYNGDSIRTVNTVKSADDWQFIIYEATPNTNYDGENLSTFALFPFTVDRTMDDYTDVAFIAFFSTAEEAWSFYTAYHTAYSAKGDSFATQYYFNINGNTNIDGNNATSFDIKGQYGTNAPLTTDCTGKTFATATSIHFGGWFATPGGIKEYGYYVVDGDTASEYKYLYTGTNANSGVYNMVVSAGIQYPQSCLMGANVAPEVDGKKGAPIDLSGYEGKTVTVIVVAKTNFGDEIELVKFTGVTVPNT